MSEPRSVGEAPQVDAIVPRDPRTEIVVPAFANDELAARLRSNTFILTTGVFLNPFSPPDITTKYTITVLDMVQSIKGTDALEDLLDAFMSNHLPANYDRSEFLEILQNEHSWMNGILHLVIREYGKETLNVQDFYRLVGSNSITSKFALMAAGRAFSISFIYKSAVRLSPNVNHVMHVEYDKVKSRIGYTVLRFVIHEDFKIDLDVIVIDVDLGDIGSIFCTGEIYPVGMRWRSTKAAKEKRRYEKEK